MAEVGACTLIIPGQGSETAELGQSRGGDGIVGLVLAVLLVLPVLAGMALAVPALASALPGNTVSPGHTVSPGNLERCARWRSAQGVEKAAVANQLGAANHLTKNQRLAEAQPGEPRSLYRTSDLQRLCRTP